MNRDNITLSKKERDRIRVIRDIEKGRIKPFEASAILGITSRQLRRIRFRYEKEGDRGLAHRSRGKASSRRIPDEVREKAMEIVAKRYSDFGPGLASEKLALDGICVSDETVRKWMIREGFWRARRRREYHRTRRERKPAFGELVQLDGSHHRWLEERGERMVLMAMIDDATNTVMGRFSPAEDAESCMLLLRDWLWAYGCPRAIYTDRHSIWVSQAGDSGYRDDTDNTQMRRCLRELGIEFIAANSPQAKGRVERLFGTLQDRLVKEMRLSGINTLEDANRFLVDEYLPMHNKRFGKEPASKANAHRGLDKNCHLERILNFQIERRVHNDYTVKFRSRLFQIDKPVYPGLRGGIVIVETHLDKSLHFSFRGKLLNWHEVDTENGSLLSGVAVPTEQPRGTPSAASASTKWIPPKNHPWRTFVINTPK